MHDICTSCGAKLRQYKHSLNELLIQALATLAAAGGCTNIARIGLTHNQICNFAKLRYWHLIARYGSEGIWRITSRGYKFLSGAIEIQKSVITYRGELVGFAGELINVHDYLDGSYMRRVDYALNSINTSTEEKLFL